ncbi:MAG: hypothetical protein WC518_00145 [Patescibacteria group bacterium]
MLLSLMQIQANINIDPEKMKQLQDQINQLSNAANSPAAKQAVSGLAIFAGWMLGLVVVLGIIMLVITIISLIDIYHWGITDKALFEKAKEEKKKWFINLILIPFIAGVVMIIPFVGWVIGGVMYIYWLVMVLVYFFGVRKKLV